MTPPLSNSSPDSLLLERDSASLGRGARALLVLMSAGLLTVFAVAFLLEPDPRGFGTHERLGLPACAFQQMFGIPCPSCGMTTSFTQFVRGRFARAAQSNAAGLLLALVCAGTIPWLWISAWRGRMWGMKQPTVTVLRFLTALCALAAVHWIARLWWR